MKRILITGERSYLGRSVDRYLQEYNAAQGTEMYRVDMISLKDEGWENTDFAPYDTVLHMVGIAHADVGHVSEDTKQMYYDVNCALAVRVAQKAKREGVHQFIYMSSVIIYGDNAGKGCSQNITADTVPSPAGFYGDSKLKAEQELKKLEADVNPDNPDFKTALIRCPMVYGRDCKGNFKTLETISGKLPIFPSIKNERSMIYVENLAEFIRILTESGKGGIFYPQNDEYVTTCDMVVEIGNAMGKKIIPCSLLNPFVKLAYHMPGKIGRLANKAFGSLTIDKALSREDFQGYCRYSLHDSIRKIYENQYNNGSL